MATGLDAGRRYSERPREPVGNWSCLAGCGYSGSLLFAAVGGPGYASQTLGGRFLRVDRVVWPQSRGAWRTFFTFIQTLTIPTGFLVVQSREFCPVFVCVGGERRPRILVPQGRLPIRLPERMGAPCHAGLFRSKDRRRWMKKGGPRLLHRREAIRFQSKTSERGSSRVAQMPQFIPNIASTVIASTVTDRTICSTRSSVV